METPSRPYRSSGDLISSPEFQFWNSGHVAATTPLHSAHQLFSNGLLLPLHSLDINSRSEPNKPEIETTSSNSSNEPSALITSQVSNPILSVSKRWKEIFRRSDKNIAGNSNNDIEESKNVKVTENRKVKNRKNNGSSTSAELNINIWPFSRSRSAGNNATRSNNKPATSNRKVSSAPCSRSNSSGESKSLRRAWPASPGRAGIHLARASPVWSVKRTSPGSVKASVPVCIGSYRSGLGCRREGDGMAVDGGGEGGVVVKSGGVNGNLFGFRGLFSKKSGSTILTV